jgi:hypothetical protein
LLAYLLEAQDAPDVGGPVADVDFGCDVGRVVRFAEVVAFLVFVAVVEEPRRPVAAAEAVGRRGSDGRAAGAGGLVGLQSGMDLSGLESVVGVFHGRGIKYTYVYSVFSLSAVCNLRDSRILQVPAGKCGSYGFEKAPKESLFFYG